jgi:hypothetical protein
LETNEKDSVREGGTLFARILIKYDFLDGGPIDIDGDRIPTSQLHIIEAVRKSGGKTVIAFLEGLWLP